MVEFYETTFDLETKKKTDLEGILFGMEDCPPSHAYGPTLRPYHLFHFVTKGNGILKIDGQVLDIGPRDAFLIPAGTLHAIGSGIVLAEIQQSSDTTYRVYDYGRLGLDGNPRPLHIEKALQVTNLSSSAGEEYADIQGGTRQSD